MVSALLPTEIYLYSGGHHPTSPEACVMEWVSLLAGLEKTDRPSCTNLLVAQSAIEINDSLNDNSRQSLVPLLPRLLRAKTTSADDRVNVRLAIWMARKWLDEFCATAWGQAEVTGWIEEAEDWLRGEGDRPIDLLISAEQGDFAMGSSRRPNEAANYLSDLLDAHEKAMAEEGVLWEDEFCQFAEAHSG